MTESIFRLLGGDAVNLFRGKSREQALKDRGLIEKFFGKAPRFNPAHRMPPKQRVERPFEYPSYWFLGGGLFFFLAAVATYAVKPHLPEFIPGLYLFLASLLLLACGTGLYFWKKITVEPAKPTKEEEEAADARKLVEDQTTQLQRIAEGALGPLPPGAERWFLQGVGRKEWNDNKPVDVREWEGGRLYSSILHFVALQLTPTLLSVRQYVLHMPTATICEQWVAEKAVVEITSISRRKKQGLAEKVWGEAQGIIKARTELEARNRQRTRIAGQIASLNTELQRLTFDDPGTDQFVIRFESGERLELTVAHQEYIDPQGPTKIAQPVGGRENVARAEAAWDAINAARNLSEAARLEQRALIASGAQVTAAGMQSMHNDLLRMHQGLADLHARMGRDFGEPPRADGGGGAPGKGPAGPQPDRQAPGAANGTAAPESSTSEPSKTDGGSTLDATKATS